MKKKILLVDDEALIAETTGMILEDEGYSVVIAHNGIDGLAKARDEAPDLIITDYMMPRMDGLEMVKNLRQEGLNIPTIMATSLPREKLPKSNRRAPYDAYLGKPFLDKDLLKAVRRLLNKGAER